MASCIYVVVKLNLILRKR